MAKTDSFFIRASVPTNGTTFSSTSIDLGAYVDALGKSVLRIHNIEVQYGSPLDSPSTTVNTITQLAMQLTTQNQTAMVDISDKSVIASGKLTVCTGANPTPDFITQVLDVAPQHWSNGYLVGVEQIYLATDAGADVSLDSVNIVLECTVETLSQSAAMALALSQQ